MVLREDNPTAAIADADVISFADASDSDNDKNTTALLLSGYSDAITATIGIKTLTNCLGLPLTTGVTGTLPVANGGTGVTTSTGTNNVVLSDSPTILTPTIASMTNAQHDHTDAAGGGTITAAAISDYASATATFTNKTIDADGTGNTISNIDVPEIQSGSNILISDIIFIIDGGGSAITTGKKGQFRVSADYTINSVTVIAKESGSIVVDINKSTFAGFPTTASIAASALPTLSGAQKSEDATLTGWTTSITAGDILEYEVDSATTITNASIILKVTKVV